MENEIEAYKESLPRSALLKLGDEAVAVLRDQAQLALTELVVWEEVDRIISRRLRLVSYSTWRRRRLKDPRGGQASPGGGHRAPLRKRRRLVDQHDRNTVVDGVDQAAGVAHE